MFVPRGYKEEDKEGDGCNKKWIEMPCLGEIACEKGVECAL